MTGWMKYALTFAAVFAFRLLPFRAPNVEPILASVMPLSKRFGALAGVLFGALSIVLYDAVTSGWGSWTATTAACYSLLGLFSYFYFRGRPATVTNFVAYSIAGIICYDFLTGPVAISLLEHESFATVFAAQIPFTILHLLGGVVFAALVSPALYYWVKQEEVPAAIRQGVAEVSRG